MKQSEHAFFTVKFLCYIQGQFVRGPHAPNYNSNIKGHQSQITISSAAGPKGALTWENRHLNLDRGVPGQHVQDPDGLNSTPVGSSVIHVEVLHGHCEGQVIRVVSDGHAAIPLFFLFSFGLHNLATHSAILSSAPIFVMPLVCLLILTPDTQRAPRGTRHRARARQ